PGHRGLHSSVSPVRVLPSIYLTSRRRSNVTHTNPHVYATQTAPSRAATPVRRDIQRRAVTSTWAGDAVSRGLAQGACARVGRHRRVARGQQLRAEYGDQSARDVAGCDV